MLRVPFDTETASRFITGFMFRGADNIGWAATESVPIGIFRPLYGATFLLDYRIWGADQLGYHLTDLILTWGACAMAFLLFRRRFGVWTAALGVSLWMLLPAQFQSMFHFYGRNDRILIYFLLGSLIVYDRVLPDPPGRRRNGRLLLAGVILSLGLLTKESVFYYGFILFAWSFMVAGRGFLRTLKEDWPLWATIFASAAVYFGIRAMLGIRFGDDNQLDTGLVYLNNLGLILLWGFPLRLSASVYPWVGGLTIAASAGLLLLRRIPGDVRFGLFCLLAGFLHLPLFWIQRSFLWIPWLFGALGIAGLTVRILALIRTRWSRTGRVLAVMVPVLLLASAGLWSLRECSSWCREPVAVDDAVTWLVNGSPGPEYSGPLAVERLPEFRAAWEHASRDPGAENKFWNWVTDLVKIRSGNRNAVVVRESLYGGV